MTQHDSRMSAILRSPAQILAIFLALMFITEFVVMLVLPVVAPDKLSGTIEALLDASLLTCVCGPILWFVMSAAKRAEEARLVLARETEALRAHQMTTLAQLATGVAHEIRNPLTSIKMLVQVNRSKFADEGLPTDDLDLVEHEIRRMERSVNSLLDYARPERAEFKPCSVQEIVRKTVKLIEGRCNAQGVQLVVKVPDDEVIVDCDAPQIQQLLLNLALNGLDAMQKGGELSISLATSDRTIQLQVADTGEGIQSSVQNKLFTPFVTTKENGVGLGLGICRRIAQSHHGSLVGGNRAARGAEFCLTLPCGSPDTLQPT
jgi:signal transduction histidine kinase